jgi:hypothetical protein
MPPDIKAATLITKFDVCIGRFDTANMHPQFYKHMARKYTNITDFSYSDERLYHLLRKKSRRAVILQ